MGHQKNVIVIGSGFAGLSAACFLAKAGHRVSVLEMHDSPGGRARQLKKDGFTFDMGPSWYWMPEVFEQFFNQFGKSVSDYYSLTRLDPSYRIYWNKDFDDLPADYGQLQNFFATLEPGSDTRLTIFLQEAKYKYDVGMQSLVYKPGLSVLEFLDIQTIKGVFRLDVFSSMKKHINRFFKHKKLRQIMEFPVLFLGALPKDIPALYSLMNYADLKLGTWYPKGGMYAIVHAMYTLATELGVTFHFSHKATSIKTDSNHKATAVNTEHERITKSFPADLIISAADYHFTETKLLPPALRSYSQSYWQSRTLAPSALLFYIGINKRLSNIRHHMLFFDSSFTDHAKEIYVHPVWPTDPLFYVSATSVTDNSVAPQGCENLFFLIPIAPGLDGDTGSLRDDYFNNIISRFEKHIREPVREHIIIKESFGISDFTQAYNSFKGNAYGLANTLLQTSLLKPSCRSKKVANLFYAGQLTVPGPGVPPSIISGEVAAKEAQKFILKEK